MRDRERFVVTAYFTAAAGSPTITINRSHLLASVLN
jgi:hypothetical protein